MDPLMGSSVVEVCHIPIEHALELPLVKDQDMIKAFLSQLGIGHRHPRTAVASPLPDLKLPLPEPHRRRVFGFLAPSG